MSVRTFANRDVNETNYDIIVVGAGPSGMCCASMLGKYGKKKVLILEAHDETPGGCSHSFTINGHSGIQFCSGIHYISINSISSGAIWKDVTGGQTWKHDRTNVFDTLILPDLKTKFEISPSNFEQQYGIKVSAISRASNYWTYLVLAKLLWWPFAKLLWLYFTWFGGKSEAEMDWADWCRKEQGKSKNDPENPVIWTQAGDWGWCRRMKEPGYSCAMLASAVAKHYCRGTTHVDGGYPEFVKRMSNVCKERGCTILIDAKVDEITFDASGAATGVTVKGVQFTAPQVVVSGVHALRKLVGEKRLPEDIKYAIEQCGESPKHGVVFLAYKNKTAAQIGLGTGNYWIAEKYFLSYKESSNGTGVYIIWEQDYVKRGPDYLEEKERRSEEAKEFIFKMFPKLAEYDDEDSATPATTEHYVQGYRGSSYGLDTPKKRFFDWRIVRALKPQVDGLPGVYMTGQDTLAIGIAGALTTGIVTAQSILYPSIIDAVFKGKNIMSMLTNEWKDRLLAERKAEEGEGKKQK